MTKVTAIGAVGVVVVLAGGAVLLVRRGAPPPATPAPEVASASSASPPPPRPRKTEGTTFELDAEERSRLALAEVEEWRSAHGEDLAGALERYRDLAKRFPETEVATYSTRAANALEERLADEARALRAEKEKEKEKAKAKEKEPTVSAPAPVRRSDDSGAKAAAEELKRIEEELGQLARSGRIDEARERAAKLPAGSALGEELARLAAGRDALRAALVEVEGERVEAFDEAKLLVKTKKREVAIARLAPASVGKSIKLAGREAASAAEFLLLRGAGALALALAQAAGSAGEPLLERARAAAAEEKAREAADALDAAIASGDVVKLKAALDRWKADAAFAAKRDAWKDAYAKARAKALQADAAPLFHAHAKTLPGGVLSIAYDWKDPKSAQDWLADPALPNSAIKVDAKRGQAQIDGHVRNPARFVGKVRVKATLLPLKGAAPNVTLVLHDQGGWDGALIALGWDAKALAKVSVPKTAPMNGGKTFVPPVDAVVLPMGAAKPESWKIAVAQPAEVCATGAKLRLEVVKDDKVLSVRANGAPVFELAPAPLPGQMGGVGFAPDSSTLVLSDVLLEGKLDPEWHQTTAAERARAEAEELAR